MQIPSRKSARARTLSAVPSPGAKGGGPATLDEEVPPRPASLVQSLRAVGYSLSAAVADVVDNSITAGATAIDIEPFWDGANSYLAIRDNGHGMDERELVEAMRLGSKSPLEQRSPGDLGRFGLGLKTASFSQCKRLTVASRRSRGLASTRTWDLDVVTARDAWTLLRDAKPVTRADISVGGASGTVVLWERMDAVVGNAVVTDTRARDRFVEQFAQVKDHLGMVFHRFMTGRNRITLRINGNLIAPWDPFLTDNDATQALPKESLSRDGKSILVRPFVLPHVSRLEAAENTSAAGPSGWTAQQGFYIYRNDRLLAGGDWLGLGFAKEEHHKLARIAVDLPNTVDHDWAIDVKKSRARPPEHHRDVLRRVATATRTRAAEVYRRRGKVLARTSGAPELVWLRKVKDGKISYVINREHPLLASVLAALGQRTHAASALFRLLEETVPVATIMVDSAERPDSLSVPFERAPTADVIAVAKQVYAAFIKNGLSPEAARVRLLATEPFPLYAAAVSAVLEPVGGKPARTTRGA